MRCLLFLLPLLAVGACTSCRSLDQLLITSDPPGAHISIDGLDTGFTTPKQLPIGGTFGRNHDVTLHKRGFRPTSTRVYQYTEGYTSKWIDGADYAVVMPPLPIFWTAGDFFFPFAVRSALVPAELYVKLYREDEPKLGFEVVAERANAQRPASAPDLK